MRIVSSFHDYYDGVQAHGQDAGMNYIRTEKEEDLGAKWPFPWIIPFSERSFRIKNHVIGFCGVLYPCLRMYTLVGPDKDAYCYSLEDVDAFIMPLLKKKELQIYEDEKRYYYPGFHVAQRRKQYRAYFDSFAKIAGANAWRFEKNLSPIFTASLQGRAYSGFPYSGRSGEPYKADPGQKILWNASLREFDFQRIKDPYTAYQEISMFMGNMAFPNKPIPEIDDLTMSEIKGFNKYSFRKDKAT